MYDPTIHHRRSIRHRGHDYGGGGGGAYSITICVQTREFLFRQVIDNRRELTELGRAVEEIWQSLKARFPLVTLDAFRVMPNHAHGIIVIPGPGLEPSLAAATGVPIIEPVRPGFTPATVPNKSNPARVNPDPTLGTVVGAFKSLSALAVNRALSRRGILWQEDYFDRIFRDVGELATIRDYIIHNPERWLDDPDNPDYP